MDEQEHVAEFIQEYDLESPPAYRLLDLVSELGEVAKNAIESTDYGDSPGELDLDSDEIGDVLFALFALSESVGIDADEALEEALAKYEGRLHERDSPSSGR